MKRRTQLEMARGLGASLRGMAGYATYGATNKATLYIGRKAGLRNKYVPDGGLLSKELVINVVGAARSAQVGHSEASSTITVAEGRYQGQREPSIKVEIAYTGAPRDKTIEGFQENIQKLAQRVAAKLGQREILIEMLTDHRTETSTASPPRAPAPTDRAEFCAWVRRHSDAAKTNSSDACYRAPARAIASKTEGDRSLEG